MYDLPEFLLENPKEDPNGDLTIGAAITGTYILLL
jgi:hypothetical protein